MAKCGDCEHYRLSLATGGAGGLCNAQKTGEMSYKMVMYHDDASNCALFEQLDEAELATDTKNTRVNPKTWKPFGDHQEVEVDVSVDADKVKDTKDWG